MSEQVSGKWKLSIGCHKGTLMSRDSDQVELDSLEACEEYVKESEKFWQQIGYFVWFANAFAPDGTKHQLHPGTSYRS